MEGMISSNHIDFSTVTKDCAEVLHYCRPFHLLNVAGNIMRPADDKRATQFLVDEVPLLKHSSPPGTETTVPSPELKSKGKGIAPSSARLAKRPAIPSLAEPSGKVIRGSPRALTLPKTNGSVNSSDLIIREESPWDTFKKYYDCDLAGTVALCVRRSGRRAVWAIRQYPRKDADRILGILPYTRHKNVISVIECFRTSDALYTLSKFHELTLDHVVACKAFPGQRQLAAIMSQVHFLVPRGHILSLIISSLLMDCHISSLIISSIPPWIVRASS